jgi:hypothetical protein
MALPAKKPLNATFEVELPPAPYPGLRPFKKDEWPIFFGREQMTDEVIARVTRQNLVVVHGDSGCGKSSLVRAGVLAQLEQERARSGVRWRTAAMRPREAPLQRLADAIAKLQGASEDSDDLYRIRRILNQGVEAPSELAELLRGGSDDHICILVDQFEELFAFASKHGREEAQLFVDILVGLQEKPPPGLYAVLTMRSEFLGHCARFKGLAEAVNRTQYLLPQMQRPALLRAIREPATLYDGEVSRALAERLIADAGGGQDQLPLIQHGLMLLWQSKMGAPMGLAEAAASFELAEAPARFEIDEAPGSFRHDAGPAWRLGLNDYQGAGALDDLLSAHADDVMEAAAPDSERQKIVAHLFRALTDINAEGNAIRRPQKLAELAEATGASEEVLKPIIDHFRAEGVSFLTPYGAAPIVSKTLIDISHEALIRCWRKIADKEGGWLQREFRDGLVWKTLRMLAQSGQILSAAATADRSRWLKTLPSETWAKRYGGDWGQVKGLIERSQELATEQEEARQREAQERIRRAEEIAAKEQELREVQRHRAEDAIASQKRQRLWTIAAFGAAAIAIITAVYALQQSHAAHAAKVEADKQRHLAEHALIETKAISFWNGLQLWNDPLSREQVATLWRLTQEDETVRVAFVRQLATSRDLLARFGFKPQPIARAVGLRWPAEAREIVQRLIARVARDQSDLNNLQPFVLVSYARGLAALAPLLDDVTLASGTLKIASAINDLAGTPTPQLTDQQLWLLAEMVGVFTESFGPEAIKPARKKLQVIIKSEESSDSAGWRGLALGRAIEVMAPDLDPEERSRAVQYLVPLLGKNTDSWAAKAIPRALATLLPELDSSQSDTALSGVPPAIAKAAAAGQTSRDSSYLVTLMQVAENLASTGKQTAVAAFGQALTKEFNSASEPFERAALAHAAVLLLARDGGSPTPLTMFIVRETLIPEKVGEDLGPSQEAESALEQAFPNSDGAPKVGRPEEALRIIDAEWRAKPSPNTRPNPYRLAAQARLVALLALSLTPESGLIQPITEDLLNMLPHTEDSLAREALARAFAGWRQSCPTPSAKRRSPRPRSRLASPA